MVLPDPGGSVPSFYQDVLIGGFSSPHIGLAALLAWGGIVTWILSTRFGLSLRAIGGDELAAGMSGIRVKSTKIAAYVLGGLLAAVGGMYMAVSMSSGSPTVGDRYILTSIAAVVVGGVPLPWRARLAAGGGHGRAHPDHNRQPALFRRGLLFLPEPYRRLHPASGRGQPRRARLHAGGWVRR